MFKNKNKVIQILNHSVDDYLFLFFFFLFPLSLPLYLFYFFRLLHNQHSDLSRQFLLLFSGLLLPISIVDRSLFLRISNSLFHILLLLMFEVHELPGVQSSGNEVFYFLVYIAYNPFSIHFLS